MLAASSTGACRPVTRGESNVTTMMNRWRKTYYHRRGADICKLCGKPVVEGDVVRIKNNGSKHHVYHELCYCGAVIEL